MPDPTTPQDPPVIILCPLGHRILQAPVEALQPGDKEFLSWVHVNLSTHRALRLNADRAQRWHRIVTHQESIIY